MTVPNNPEQAPRRAAVYRLWNAGGDLLYIGSAYDPDHRCKSHQKTPWWPEVARRTEEWFDHRGTAYTEELKAIGVEKSKYNQMGTPGYRTPDTEAIRRRKELGPLRQQLLQEAWDAARDARTAARSEGASSDGVERAGKLAEIEFLDATGLFVAAVKERRRRLADSDERAKEAALSGYRNSGMTQQDYEAREQLIDVAMLVEKRWPDEHLVLCRDLRDLADTISEEVQG